MQEKEWWERDIFEKEGECPANTGGEKWAKFTREEATS